MKQINKTMVIVNQNSGYLMIDLANYIQRFRPTVLLTGRLILRDNPLEETVQRDNLVAYDRSTTLKRLFTWTLGFMQICWKLAVKYPKSDVIAVSNPPFSLFLPLLFGKRIQILVYDLYPDALVEQKLLHPKGFIFWCWSFFTRKSFARARRIMVISEGMKELATAYAPGHRIEVIPLWTHPKKFYTASECKTFYKSLGIEADFIVLYSGNIGKTQPLEPLVGLAKSFSNSLSQVAFVICGEGEQKEQLQTRAEKLGLNNMFFLPWQSAENLPFLLGGAQLGFIPLAMDAGKISVPSKTFDFLAAGLPIAAFCSEDAELGKLVSSNACGNRFDLDGIEQLEAYIQNLATNPNQLSSLEKAAVLAAGKYTPENVKLIFDV